MEKKVDSWPLARPDGVVHAKWFIVATVVSFAIYLVLFGFILHKPQTIGRHHKLIIAKTEALQGLAKENKLVILAGSNGRVSHSAAVIAHHIGIPAVNMSVTASMSIDYQLNRLKPHLIAGDIVYLPLEYSQLRKNKKMVYSGIEAPYVVAYEKESLSQFTFLRRLHAYLFFDIRFIFSAIAEMSLSAMDYERRITSDDFNEWGDQTGHTIEKGKPYIGYIESVDADAKVAVVESSFSAKSVAEFLDWATANKVTVVGGYPAYAEGGVLPQREDEKLKYFYESRGHYFLNLENKGRYPKSCFFDTVYHLAEPYQIEHSTLVATNLKHLLSLSTSP